MYTTHHLRVLCWCLLFSASWRRVWRPRRDGGGCLRQLEWTAAMVYDHLNRCSFTDCRFFQCCSRPSPFSSNSGVKSFVLIKLFMQLCILCNRVRTFVLLHIYTTVGTNCGRRDSATPTRVQSGPKSDLNKIVFNLLPKLYDRDFVLSTNGERRTAGYFRQLKDDTK